ncbi:MAG: hypothetical protein R3D67_06570 [Hyphomicrobiaceae bacterium]
MGGRGLGDLIEGFLVADGFTVDKPAAHCLRGERASGDGVRESRLVWFADPDHGVKPETASLLRDFEIAKDVLDAHSLGFFVTPSLAGLSTAFRQAASAAGVGIRVPVQFFDTAYKLDDEQAGFGEGAGSSASEVFRRFHRHGRALSRQRVGQPYEVLSGLGTEVGGFGHGDDLLSHLEAELGAPDAAPRLTLIVGNAGAGKSHLFASLFASLHERFLEAKRHHRGAMRPVVFLPEHIRDQKTASLDGLLAAVAGTDAGAATSLSMMRFLNREGFTLWMFDGLDEFFAGETDFVDALETSLRAGSRGHILIAARDSLLTSSNALSGLVERYIGRGTLRIYELSRWGRMQQEALAKMGAEGDRLTSVDAASFLAALDADPAAAELATLPYYCDVMLDLFGRDMGGPLDELALLEQAVDNLIDREQDKLATGELGFGWDVFAGAETFVEVAEVVEGFGVDAFQSAERREQVHAALTEIGRDRLVELVEGIAHRIRTRAAYPNEGKGLTTQEIEALAHDLPRCRPGAGFGAAGDAGHCAASHFSGGGAAGTVRFAHEIIADYLAGRRAMALLREGGNDPAIIARALGVRCDLDRSVMLRYLVRELTADPDLSRGASCPP